MAFFASANLPFHSSGRARQMIHFINDRAARVSEEVKALIRQKGVRIGRCEGHWPVLEMTAAREMIVCASIGG